MNPIGNYCLIYEAAARDSVSGFMQLACPSVRLFVCVSVCLSVAKIQKRDFLKN